MNTGSAPFISQVAKDWLYTNEFCAPVSYRAPSSTSDVLPVPPCRTWFARVAESADELVRSVLPPGLQAAAVELAPYLVDSIGNSTRIDYGTGHETTFCALLCCLAKLGVLTKADLQVALRHLLYSFGSRRELLLSL